MSDLATAKTYVDMRQIMDQGMLTLRGDLKAAKIRKAVKDATDQTMPKQTQVAVDGMTGAAWMSPDEALVLLPHAELAQGMDTMHKALKGAHALLVDVSDARCMFELKGAAVREVLAKLAPVDTTPAALKIGHIRRTRLAQVAGAFWLVDDETAHIVAFRSVTDYVAELLGDAISAGSQVFAS